jgi:hypothetical protein
MATWPARGKQEVIRAGRHRCFESIVDCHVRFFHRPAAPRFGRACPVRYVGVHSNRAPVAGLRRQITFELVPYRLKHCADVVLN